MFGPHDQHFRKRFCREITQLHGIQPNLIVSLPCFPDGADYIRYDACRLNSNAELADLDHDEK
jgi:hypothetical protein